MQEFEDTCLVTDEAEGHNTTSGSCTKWLGTEAILKLPQRESQAQADVDVDDVDLAVNFWFQLIL